MGIMLIVQCLPVTRTVNKCPLTVSFHHQRFHCIRKCSSQLLQLFHDTVNLTIFLNISFKRAGGHSI